MKEKTKVKYNMWQMTGFMLRSAWKVSRRVPILCVLMAVVTAGKSTVEMLIAPMILEKVETTAPLGELIAVILGFSAGLLLLTGLGTYIDANSIYGYVTVRTYIIKRIGDKLGTTSYPNMLDTKFIQAENKASRACSHNYAPAENVWRTWTDILTNVMGFCIYMTFLSRLNLWMMAIIILTTTIGYFVNKRIGEWGYHHREEEAAYTQKMAYIRRMATGREGAKDIRIFGLKEWLDDVWQSTFRLYQAFLAKRERVYLWTNVVDMVLTFLRNGVAYGYLIWMTLSEGMNASEFLLYFSAVSGFTTWIAGILDRFSVLHKESMELSTIREFLEWPEPFCYEEGASLPKDFTKDYQLCLENVSYRYPEAESDTIKHMNLIIKPGEKLAIVGLNGAGKTTLVKLLCGFLDPTEGRILLNGEDIRKYNRREYYDLFSAVFQDFSVLEASVAVNVAQNVDNIDENRVRLCIEKAGLTEKVSSLPAGIESKIGRQIYEDGVELSGGQTQRLMLARALYKNGAVLVLDEPTAALDPIAENDIYHKYSEMTKGKTSLFISHRLASTRFCDRILFLENGEIGEEGTHESLIALGGRYAELFEVQSRYYKEGGENNGEDR